MRRVLFVDDDPPILDALRMRMRRMRESWDVQFANSGREAIARFEQAPFDVIVTDQRMPEMDGAALLNVIRERWPATVRIVLSGYSDAEQTMRLVPLAHQYISKPCDPDELESLIERSLTLRQLMQQARLRDLVGRIGALPPAPSTFAQVQAAIASESSSVADIARVVERDTIVTAKLLQLVNSGFFRLPRRISEVREAIGYLGINTVRSLIVSAEVFSRWPCADAATTARLAMLQHHSCKVAAAVLALAPRSPVAPDALLAALLHDIGYWILSYGSSDKLDEAQRLALGDLIPLDVAEERVFGASHAEVGAYLLGLWGFSTPVVEAVAFHHAPSRIQQERFDSLALLCSAHALTDPAEVEAFPGLVVSHSEVTGDYLSAVGAPFGWNEAIERVATIRGQHGEH